MRQNILIFAGILAVLFGLVFMLQGLGVIRWPATSMMVGSDSWVIRGAIIALLGAILVGGVRLVPMKRRRRD